ncbi:MAG: hypothetical protein E6Q74_02675 [Pseudoxanthomonas sp.]|nr:MAG: hypothetical protein E6Q74_02675 [Pseudoxanthomonas sp.]
MTARGVGASGVPRLTISRAVEDVSVIRVLWQSGPTPRPEDLPRRDSRRRQHRFIRARLLSIACSVLLPYRLRSPP